MHTLSLIRSARRKPGMAFTIGLLFLGSLRPARGGEVTITATGKLAGVVDYMHVFGKPLTIPAGTPYTLVFTFDDAKGRPIQPGACPSGGTGIAGAGTASPGTAVLTIGDKSHEFGRERFPRSSAWRAVATVCSESGIAVLITEGQEPFETKIFLRLQPTQGMRSLTQEVDWKSPVTLTRFYAPNGMNGFAVNRQNNYMGSTHGYFVVEQVTIGGPKKNGVIAGR